MTGSSLGASVRTPANAYRQLATFVHALLFVLGFATMFVIVWGGAATLLGQALFSIKPLLSKLGGIVVIGFGLVTLGMLRIPLLFHDTRPRWLGQRIGWWPSVLLGVFFAAGWTPCVGTTLGAILTLGVSGQTAGQAMLLSSGYALGLGLPFLALSLMVERTTRIVRHLRRYQRIVQIISGVLLIGMGVLLLTNQLFQIAIWALRNGLFLDVGLGSSDTPTYFLATVAGLLSFLSPCVLPLVPAYLGYLSGRSIESGATLGDRA